MCSIYGKSHTYTHVMSWGTNMLHFAALLFPTMLFARCDVAAAIYSLLGYICSLGYMMRFAANSGHAWRAHQLDILYCHFVQRNISLHLEVSRRAQRVSRVSSSDEVSSICFVFDDFASMPRLLSHMLFCHGSALRVALTSDHEC